MAARKRILRWNTVEARPSAIPLGLRAAISERLGEDRERLSRIVGRNLDHWLSPEPCQPRQGWTPSPDAVEIPNPWSSSGEQGLSGRRPAAPIGRRPVVGALAGDGS